MTPPVVDPVITELAEIVSGALGVPVDEIPTGISLRNGLGVDSVAVLEIVLAVESRFRTPIPDSELGRFADRSLVESADWIRTELRIQPNGSGIG